MLVVMLVDVSAKGVGCVGLHCGTDGCGDAMLLNL